MKATEQMLGDRWMEEQFEIRPQVAVPRRGSIENQLEELKVQLLNPLLEKVAGANATLARELAWAANEAAALAWFTVCPLLVLPALLDEKVRGAMRHWEKQEQMFRECRV